MTLCECACAILFYYFFCINGECLLSPPGLHLCCVLHSSIPWTRIFTMATQTFFWGGGVWSMCIGDNSLSCQEWAITWNADQAIWNGCLLPMCSVAINYLKRLKQSHWKIDYSPTTPALLCAWSAHCGSSCKNKQITVMNDEDNKTRGAWFDLHAEVWMY